MKLYQEISSKLMNNQRRAASELLPPGITLDNQSNSAKIQLNATLNHKSFWVIVTPDFIKGFSLGYGWMYADTEMFTKEVPHIIHIFTELLNQEID